ncbi:Triostin synthetase I [Streptomyces viridochromogenes]|uniref:Triostin synthetase I n=1 Tax=Streptomyces viridochromogenes TaxID=1938 RepID=A0A0J7Z1T7_STRVR|nr:(2,3-dihydroxybenzoyl)adenylate synthase [Streptomyces viridochromogenes]KMS69961.1 Triostin synthetase I [Streptomyces viridochromogenes]KOG15641.1 Triostin synthetase I [Streptomyces viridochromogenes]
MAAPISEGTVPWPKPDADRYTAAGYWTGRPLGDLLRETADRTPDTTALVDGDLRLTYAELADRADALAVRLLDLGLGPGDRMVVQLPNGWEFTVLTWACLRAGIVPVMALPAHRRLELAYLAAHAEAAAIAVPDRLRDFDHQALAHELGKELPGPWHVLVAGDDIDPAGLDLRTLCAPGEDPAADRARLDAAAPGSRDVAVFLLSGGTTGLPKLIARTHDDYAYNARASAEVSGVDATAVYLVSLPAGHNFPLACPGILGTLLAGGRVVMLPSPEPARVFATVAAEEVTHTAVVPAVAGRWLEHAEQHGAGQMGSLRVLQVGGSRLADELARRVRPVLGTTLQQVFGMAEGLLNYTLLDDPEDVICTTQGRPMCPDDEVRLVDELDRDVPDGEPGSLLTRGPYTPRGYYRAPEHNKRAFTEDGWYRSGDICRRTPEGNLVVEGRDKDMINRGGEKVSAEEVENLVYELADVSQVAAVAMPDPALGERVCLYVVAAPGHPAPTLDAIRAAMEEAGVARFKLPEHLVCVQELAATKVGKIDKKALRADIAERIGSGTS